MKPILDKILTLMIMIYAIEAVYQYIAKVTVRPKYSSTLNSANKLASNNHGAPHFVIDVEVRRALSEKPNAETLASAEKNLDLLFSEMSTNGYNPTIINQEIEYSNEQNC